MLNGMLFQDFVWNDATLNDVWNDATTRKSTVYLQSRLKSIPGGQPSS